MTVPPHAGRESERRVFVYAERDRLETVERERWLARIFEEWSDPSWDPPWGMVIDLDATAAGGFVAGVVKGTAFVVLDSRMKDDPRRYALVQVAGGSVLGGLHHSKWKKLAPAIQERARRDGRSPRAEFLELRVQNAALALAATADAAPRSAFRRLKQAFFGFLVNDLASDVPDLREQPFEAVGRAPDWGSVPSPAAEVDGRVDVQAALREAKLSTREYQACEAVMAGKALTTWADEVGIEAATARGYWATASRKLRPHLDLP